MTVRTTFFLLVLANLVFLTWVQGHWGSFQAGHEPHRLGQQLNAEKLRVSSSRWAAGDCRLIDGLSEESSAALKKAVENLGWTARLVTKQEPYYFLVLVPELPNKAAADKKSGELERLGIKDFTVVALENQRHEIHFARLKDEQSARDFLLALSKKGVVSARQERRDADPTRFQIEISSSKVKADDKLQLFLTDYAGITTVPCAESHQ